MAGEVEHKITVGRLGKQFAYTSEQIVTSYWLDLRRHLRDDSEVRGTVAVPRKHLGHRQSVIDTAVQRISGIVINTDYESVAGCHGEPSKPITRAQLPSDLNALSRLKSTL